jgi:hypothetical protein
MPALCVRARVPRVCAPRRQVTNGLEAAYNYVRNSPVVEPTDDVVGALAGATLQVRGACSAL